jgi:hypothetical protein
MNERPTRGEQMEPPPHPESQDDAPYEPPASPSTWATRVVIAVFVLLFALIVVLHLTGVVGPGAH